MTKKPAKSSARFQNARKAFTLVEMLVALVLTGVVLSAAGRVTVAVLRSEQAASHQLRTALHRSIALDAIDRDWGARFGSSNDIEIVLDASLRPTIRMFALVKSAGANGITVQRPARVTYHVEIQDHATSSLALIRDVDIQTEHNAIRSEVVACNLESVEVEIFSEKKWQSVESRKHRDPKRIDAVRVSLCWSDAESQSRVFMLVGDRP